MDFQDLMNKVNETFPGSYVDVDLDGQIIIYTNLQMLDSEDNPSIPLGEYLIQEMQI